LSSERADQLRAQILDLVREYHGEAFAGEDFVPGESQIRYAGRVFDEQELVNLTDSSLDFWLTAGRYARRFEAEFATLFGLRSALLVNSGSSANLVALTALTSPKLGEKRLRPGDAVLTVATGSPTTAHPTSQNGCAQVFVDVEWPT